MDQDEADRSIRFVSNVLKAMSDHANVSRIELAYKGFEDWLRGFEARFKVFVKEFEKASEEDSIEEYTEIVSKISGKHQWIFWILINFSFQKGTWFKWTNGQLHIPSIPSSLITELKWFSKLFWYKWNQLNKK